ncbi:MAG: serine/threonine-protein kinase [Sandaracinaceae bacterium]
MSGSVTIPSGRYRVVRQLASGGMGEVELAIRAEAGFRRVFAVKRLAPALRDDRAARAMFIDEGRLAGLIRHPNVVSVLDVGEDERGPYLVMEFVEGISASALLRWAATSGVLLPVQLCLRLVRDVALGLHSAHEITDHEGRPLRLVHRDVSPQNVLIGFDGIACVADFGIAKAAGRTTRTTTGLLKGKTGYMSPEQLRFEEMDRRSDIFSLAVVLWELLAARRLYREEENRVAARRILYEPPPDIDDIRGDVPPEVVELLFLALSKEPDARPDTAAEVARRLDAAIGALVADEGVLDVGAFVREHFAARRAEIHEMIAGARTAAPSSTGSRVRRRALIAALTAVAIVGIGATGWALAAVSAEEPSPPRPAAPAPAREADEEEEPPPAAEPAEAVPAPVAPAEEPPAAASRPRGAARRSRGRRASRSGSAVGDDGLFRWE